MLMVTRTKAVLPGFNRYMVECESFKCDLNRFAGLGFNRYMVECELNRIQNLKY